MRDSAEFLPCLLTIVRYQKKAKEGATTSAPPVFFAGGVCDGLTAQKCKCLPSYVHLLTRAHTPFAQVPMHAHNFGLNLLSSESSIKDRPEGGILSSLIIIINKYNSRIVEQEHFKHTQFGTDQNRTGCMPCHRITFSVLMKVVPEDGRSLYRKQGHLCIWKNCCSPKFNILDPYTSQEAILFPCNG